MSDSPVPILFVHHAADLGGASLSLVSLIDQLDRRRYAPSVLFNCRPGSVAAPFLERGIPVHVEPSITTYPHGQGAWLSLRSLRPWEMLTLALRVGASARRFREFLSRHPCDIVHLNSSVQVPAALGANAAGVPVVWHIREELHPGYFGLRRAWIRRCIARCATQVVAISNQNAAQLRPMKNLSVVYNPVDFSRFDRSIGGGSVRRELNLPESAPVIGMLGGVLDSKGADLFVESAIRVRERRPDAVFLIAGLPPAAASPSRIKRGLREAVEASGVVPSVQRRVVGLLERHSLGAAVRLLGLRRDVPEVIAACDIVAWPATVSHFARPIIEAGAMGRPVVAADFASTRELVDPGRTGLLFPPKDSAGQASAILQLLEQPDRARSMGEAGFRLARERYDARRSAEMITRIYDALPRPTSVGSAA